MQFDSIREAEVARDFELEKRAGIIKEIEYQPAFELLPRPNRVVYVADFRITYADGRVEVVDVKGFETAVFKLKKKMLRHFYPQVKLVLMQ